MTPTDANGGHVTDTYIGPVAVSLKSLRWWRAAITLLVLWPLLDHIGAIELGGMTPATVLAGANGMAAIILAFKGHRRP